MFILSEWGMTRLETLIELKFRAVPLISMRAQISMRAFRACPLIEIRQTVPCRAIRGNGISVNRTVPAVAEDIGLQTTAADKCKHITAINKCEQQNVTT